MNVMPHPIQYQGSKRNLASGILPYFPNDIQTLYEPFAGSAAMTIAAAASGLAQNFVINDLNQPLANLLQRIVEFPAETSAFYAAVWHQQGEDAVQSVAHFNAVREEFNCTQKPELLLYLLSRCIKGAVRYNKCGEFNQSPDKRRRGTLPKTMQRNIFGVSQLLKGKSRFTSVDYQVAVGDAGVQDLIYMDPPYQGVSGERDSRYLAGLAFDSFVASLERFNQRGLSFIVSYDGTLGNRSYGQPLPQHLDLQQLNLPAGRSSTATLLGRDDVTVESLYLSKPLVNRLADQSLATMIKVKPAESGNLLTDSHESEVLEAVY